MPSAPPTPRWSTSDLIGPTLIFVGGFLLAVTIALPTFFVGGLRSVPLSTDLTTVATARDASILDRCSLQAPHARTLGADLVRQQRVVAVQPSDAHRITLQAGTSVQAETVRVDGRRVESDAPRPGSSAPEFADRPCTEPTVTAVKDRVTLDRGTARPLSGGAASEIQYDSRSAPVPVPDRRGYTYLLPFDVDDSTHTFFDPITRRSVPLRHIGTTQVAGRDVEQFRAEIPDTDLGVADRAVPQGDPTTITRRSGWFGVPGVDRELTATLHHRSSWVLAVDRRTGIIVDTRIEVDEAYRFTPGRADVPADFALPRLRAVFAYDEQTRSAMSRHASDLATPLLVWGRLVPIGTGILGVAALVAGLLFLRPRRVR